MDKKSIRDEGKSLVSGSWWERMTYIVITTVLAFAAYLLPGISITKGTIIFFASLLIVILVAILLAAWTRGSGKQHRH